MFSSFALLTSLAAESMISAAQGQQSLLPVVEKNLCQLYEVLIASCTLEGRQGDIVSICADPKSEMVSYHLELNKKTEITASFNAGRKIFRWVNEKSYTTYFGFNRLGYSYILEIPQETLGARAALYSKKAKEVFDYDASSRQCTNNSFGDKYFVSPAIEDLDDVLMDDRGIMFPPNHGEK